MKTNYLSIIREKGEFDFEVSAMIEDLTREEYEQLKRISNIEDVAYERLFINYLQLNISIYFLWFMISIMIIVT